MRVALTKEESTYVGEIDVEYRDLFRARTWKEHGGRGLDAFDDAWHQVLVSVGAAIVDGSWPKTLSRPQEDYLLRCLFRDARRYYMMGVDYMWARQSGQRTFTRFDVNDPGRALDLVAGEIVDGCSEVLDLGAYIIWECIYQLGKAAREVIQDVVALYEDGELSECGQKVGFHELLCLRAAARGGGKPDHRRISDRFQKAKRRLWVLLCERGVVKGEMPRGPVGKWHKVHGRRRGNTVRPKLRL